VVGGILADAVVELELEVERLPLEPVGMSPSRQTVKRR
jgi:hypothetical protein